MYVCICLYTKRERERLRVTCGFGDTFLLPGAFYLSFEIQFSLQRAVLMTLIWNLSPSIVLAKVQSYLWRLLALLSDPNSMIILTLTLTLPCHGLRKTFSGLYSGNKLCQNIGRGGRSNRYCCPKSDLSVIVIMMCPGSIFLFMDNKLGVSLGKSILTLEMSLK